MLVHRVFAYLSTARTGEPGHPEYLHSPQGKGRWDNPEHYTVWYVAESATGAIAEVFADLDVWSESMFDAPFLPGARRTLGIYHVPDDLAVFDLDDPQNLVDLALRPTQVVQRNRSASQAVALRVFNQVTSDGVRVWAGMRWWSVHRPQWKLLALWDRETTPRVADVEELTLDHPAIRDAAETLAKPVSRPGTQ